MGPRLAELACTDGIFRWETAHRGDTRRASRKVIQCSVDLLAFGVVPLAGLVVYWVGGQVAGPGLLVLSVVEALAVLGVS